MHETETAKPPQTFMLDLIVGYWLSCAVHVAARLGVADHLAAGPKTTAELARLCGAHERSLARLLRMLAGSGVFREASGGRFENTALSETLRADARGSMRGFALMMPDDHNLRAWGDLSHSVRTGEPAFDRVHGLGNFEWLAKHPREAEEFGQAMTSISGLENPHIADAYDFARIARLVDVGGSHGSLVAEILRRNPRLRGAVYDRPEVIEVARRTGPTRANGIAERCELIAGDFFAAVPPGADAYVMKYILHDWDDERSERILSNCRRAMASGGRVLVVDNVVPPGNDPHWSKLLDVNMLVLTSGRERTREDFDELFRAAGLRLSRVVPTACPLSIVEGVAA